MAVNAYTLVYSRQAKRTLKSMPKNVARKIQEKMVVLANDPYGQHVNARKLQGREGYRLRVGDWRVIYDIVDDRLMVHVVRIASRGNVYEP